MPRNDAMLPERLLTLAEVSEVIGCSIKTVRRRIAAGALRVFRDGRLVRVRPSDSEGVHGGERLTTSDRTGPPKSIV